MDDSDETVSRSCLLASGSMYCKRKSLSVNELLVMELVVKEEGN